MHTDWVKKRGKVLRRILNTLKVEEKELAAKGIIVSFDDARNEIYSLLVETSKLEADESKPGRPLRSKFAAYCNSSKKSGEIVKKSGYVIRKSGGGTT